MCEMHANGLCTLKMSINQQVVGYHVYQIYTMSSAAFLCDSRISTFSTHTCNYSIK